MRWSVLLPTHNRPHTLRLAIESALAQTEPEFELLVVGDGCTDETAAVVAAFGDARIRWFDLPKGPGFGYGNRNVALREARGDYVAYLAHDDLFAPDHLRLLGEELDRTGAALAYSRPLWAHPDGRLYPFSFDLRDPARRTDFETGNWIPAPCVAVRRDALEAAGWWPAEVPAAGDWELWKSILATDAAAGGPGPAYVATPTTIHFRTIRNDLDHGTVTNLREAAGEDWPAALGFERAEGEVEQDAVHRLQGRDPAAWWGRVRAGVETAEHRLAWDNLGQRHAIAVLEGRVTALEGALEEQARASAVAAASAAADRAALAAAYEGSTSWRLTAPLRALRRARGRGGAPAA